MKKIAKIYRWIITSVILQFIVLIFLNNFYFAQDSSFKLTSVNIDERNPKTKITIPDGSINPKVSFDGLYSSYLKDGKLNIVDMYTGLVTRTIQDEEMEVSYYKWLPDRNIVIYGMNRPSSRNGRIRVGTLVMETEVEHEYPEIKDLPEGSVVEGIELSTLTNNVYVKIRTSQYWAEIYKLNIMSRLSHVKGVTAKTIIAELNLKDTLLYMSEGTQLKERDGNIDSTDYHTIGEDRILLATDSEDRIYIGEKNEEGKIYRILIGESLEAPIEQWTECNLNRPDEAESLKFTFKGSMYRLEESEGALYNLRTGKVLQYEGSFEEITDNFIASVNGRDLVIKKIDN